MRETHLYMDEIVCVVVSCLLLETKKNRNAPFHLPAQAYKKSESKKSFFFFSFFLNFYDIAWPALWTRMDRSHIDETKKKKKTILK